MKYLNYEKGIFPEFISASLIDNQLCCDHCFQLIKKKIVPNFHLGIGILKWHYEVLSENQASPTEIILGVYFLLITKNIIFFHFFDSIAL